MTLKFEMNDRVEFHSTSSDKLDGKIVTVIGISSLHAESAFFIVGFDEPYTFDISENTPLTVTALVMTEHCLRKVA